MSLLEKDKRKFTVIIGSKKCGTYYGASPYLAAKKVNGKSGGFYLKEMTNGSKKKLYGPYSSKKRVVQRGGEEKSLREYICDTVLRILQNCDKQHEFDHEMARINYKYKILETTYLFLGIDHRRDKCSFLKDIIRRRNNYNTKNGIYFPLCYCLCSLTEKDDNIIEFLFINDYKETINQRIIKESNFYTNNWLKLINFLRITIQQIEIEILKENRKNSIRLKEIKKELNEEKRRRNEENQIELNKMRLEIEEAKRKFARGGPAEEPNSNYRPPESMMSAIKRSGPIQNIKPIQPISNLEKKLANALRND
jgi:hypothetical protein